MTQTCEVSQEWRSTMKLASIISKAPKRFMALGALVAVAAIVVPAVVNAWGPTRQTFTVEKPADYVTFNSITNNPNYGDERNFVTIKDAANQNKGGWTDDIKVKNGKEYYVRMYVHNNAAENLKLVAENTVAQFNVPSHEAKRIQIDGYLSASNAKPGKVWDQAVFTADSNFKLDYVKGSATYTNNVFTGGTKLSDAVVTSGAKLGYDKLDGKIPGCFKYDGFVIFKVKATTSDFSVNKTVRLTDSSDKTFKETVTAKPGDKVDFQIEFKNTGGSQLKDVTIKDVLPKGLTYVKDSTYLANSAGARKISDGVTAGGAVIGGYLSGANAFIKFTATVNKNDDLPKCGINNLVNTATATTSKGQKSDTATVKTEKECEEIPPTTDKIKVCELKTSKIITIDETDFDSSKHSKNLADCEKEPTTPTEPETPTNPEVPTELPQTGSEGIVALTGLGALIASVAYYVSSRRALGL